MKEERASALNWAIWALIGVAVLYVIVSIFGTMPTLTEGGYVWSVSIKTAGPVSITMPKIGAGWWLLFVPWVVFALRFFFELGRNNLDKIKGHVVSSLIIAAVVGSFTSIGVNEPSGVFLGMSVGLACGLITVMVSDIVAGVLMGTISSTMPAVVFLLFFSPHKAGGILFLPGIAVTLLLVNLMIAGIVPLVIATYERLFSKASWVAWGKALHMGVTASATAQQSEQTEEAT